MKIINTEKVIIKSWCNNPEEGALEQARTLANLPFIFKQVCLMPDTHQGFGMPIGGVIATKDVVIPNAVGVDIGCGMCAVQTNLKAEELTKEKIKEIFDGSEEYKGGIRSRIPLGMSEHKKKQHWYYFNEAPQTEIVQQYLEKAKKQLGTLGGGNHFIEFQKDQDNFVWIMIHSGSRHFGYQIAHHYNKIAQNLCLKWYSNIPKFKGQDGLAFLPIDSIEGKEYLEAMNFALEYAIENRRRMMQICLEEVNKIFPKCTLINNVNIHHNYAAKENHFGKNVMVHRKGATLARKGIIGIIPGSQGTSSYIVEGLGNPDSFHSCSHGAGRTMSRIKAIKNLDLEKEQKILEKQNIVHNIRNKKDLDEASGAYKDINIVMEEQKDLVKILHKLTPLGVIKG